jgi:hypothetical protein
MASVDTSRLPNERRIGNHGVKIAEDPLKTVEKKL